MNDLDPVLGDPAKERLVSPAPGIAERDRRWAESHRAMRIVVVAAFLLGLAILAIGVVWYVIAELR